MDINLCRYRTLNGQRSFKYSGAKEWNMLPLDIKNEQIVMFQNKGEEAVFR